MKRPVVVMLIIGAVVSGLVCALHALGLLLKIEQPIAGLISHYHKGSYPSGEFWQYLLIIALAFGMAALTALSLHRIRMLWVAGALLIELFVLAWVCALYHVLFQPLPSILAVLLAFVAAERTVAFVTHGRASLARRFFGGRISSEQMQRVVEGEMPLDEKAKTCEVTVIACDIANKYDLAEETDPAAFAEVTEKFIHRATDLFLKAGAYIQAADGEGVVAMFGFPNPEPEHAEKAVRVTLDLVNQFRDSNRRNNGQVSGNDIHLGISSGTMIIAPLRREENQTLLTTGESVELARRFCVANRFYGSRILMGPRTFELASKMVVARPIDFLSGVNTQERHEIYEPLWLAAEAKPEHLARRDSFWNGVVLYREKRWAEAYSEFQKARGPDAENDAPLQLYLRRLEPLALHLAETPFG